MTRPIEYVIGWAGFVIVILLPLANAKGWI